MMTNFVGSNQVLKDYKYKGSKELPLTQWVPFFKGARKGSNYKVLVQNDGILTMSNTPVEKRSNKEILDKATGDVLIVGLGINLINDKVLKVKGVKSVTTMEIDEDVIDNVPTKTTVFKGDCAIDYPELHNKFDTIYWDSMGSFDEKIMRKYLKNTNSILLTWNIDYGS